MATARRHTWLQDDCNHNQPENIAYDSDGDGFNDSFLHNYFRDFCPICRDAEVNGTTTRHVLATDPDHYDADDYARDQADLLVTLSNRDMIFFTIGLGPQVEHTNLGRPDAGLQLLQYIADVAHGQYYASASPADLGHIFEDIAQRIFTRITR